MIIIRSEIRYNMNLHLDSQNFIGYGSAYRSYKFLMDSDLNPPDPIRIQSIDSPTSDIQKRIKNLLYDFLTIPGLYANSLQTNPVSLWPVSLLDQKVSESKQTNRGSR
jgi:hypothetical protein